MVLCLNNFCCINLNKISVYMVDLNLSAGVDTDSKINKSHENIEKYWQEDTHWSHSPAQPSKKTQNVFIKLVYLIWDEYLTNDKN